jgi:hypothetical protein
MFLLLLAIIRNLKINGRRNVVRECQRALLADKKPMISKT